MAQQSRPHPASAQDGDRAGSPAVEVVRSEERLRVGREVRVTGRALLRRYVVTETVTQTFQVRREEVRLEHEPGSGAGSGPGSDPDRAPLAEGVAVEMVLHREVPRVVMDVVATERVRLHVDTVTEQVNVSDTLQKEQVALDPPEPAGR